MGIPSRPPATGCVEKPRAADLKSGGLRYLPFTSLVAVLVLACRSLGLPILGRCCHSIAVGRFDKGLSLVYKVSARGVC